MIKAIAQAIKAAVVPTEEEQLQKLFPGIDEVRTMSMVTGVRLAQHPSAGPYLIVSLLPVRNNIENYDFPPMEISVWPRGSDNYGALGFRPVSPVENWQTVRAPIASMIVPLSGNYPFNHRCLGEFGQDFRAAQRKSLREGVACALVIMQAIYLNHRPEYELD